MGQGDSERIEGLIGGLGSARFEERERAAKDLMLVGAPALEPLRRALKSSDPEVVRRSEKCIRQIELNLRIAALVGALKDKSPQVRAQSATDLGKLGRDAKDAVPSLVKVFLDDEDATVRGRAVGALWEIGPEAKAAVPKFLELLKEKRSPYKLRCDVAFALGHIGPGAEEATPALVDVLETGGPELKRVAAFALGRIGGKDKRVVPALLKALNDPSLFVQSNAAIALGKLAREPERTVPALVDMVKRHQKRGESNIDPCQCAIGALGGFGAHAKSTVPLLLAIATDKNEEDRLRVRAIEALGAIGPAARDAAPALRALLKDPLVDDEAAKALEAIERAER
jgi:HEAT repeat protein